MNTKIFNSMSLLGREEAYLASPRVWSFKFTDDIVNGLRLNLSNMVGAYPFEFGGRTWRDSERLYLCGEFSTGSDQDNAIQRKLVEAKSGYAAKRFVKSANKRFVRPDFASFRLQWMLFCVWQKCKGNAEFRSLLCRIPEDVILVENTTTDNGGSAEIWGCKNPMLVAARKDLAQRLSEEHQDLKKKELAHLINVETNKVDSIGEWRGQNNIGKILMICRDCLLHGTEPEIDYELLSRANIFILGKRLLAS